MVAVVGHRGPDGHGFFRDERAGLGQARLSIVDIKSGAQPMTNEDETLWIVFNGEIFNHVELRLELQKAGHRFQTTSDTEVILHAYEQWGGGAWSRFNGQFAVALWDAPRRRLVLARDPFGIHPLHYAASGAGVVFASEIKSLFASGRVPVEFDAGGLVQVFTRWSCPAPETVFAGVRSVPPGCMVTIESDLTPRMESWWQPDFAGDASLQGLTLEDAAEELERLLRRAVSLRLRADVPVGAYLSGGLDSSITTTLIERSGPLETFSIRFEEPAFDETEQQRIMVAKLGTRHHEVLVRNSDIAEHLPRVVKQCETPLLRTGAVPLFMLSDLVRTSGMKVVLTGEGADELFAGYSVFKEDKVRRFWARSPRALWRAAPLSRIHHYVGSEGDKDGQMWRDFFRRGLEDVENPAYSHAIRWDNTAWCTRFLRKDLVGGVDRGAQWAALERSFPASWRSWSPLARAQLLEIATFMSPYLLVSQGDRVALAHGVEVRYPFLDPDVISFAGRLPGRLKLRGLKDKRVLRAVGARHLPPEISGRRKQPYRAPTSSAFFRRGAPAYVREMLSGRALEESGLFESRAAGLLAEKAWSREGRMGSEREEMALMGILTLQLLSRWLRSEFAAEVVESARRLAGTSPSVLVDRVSSSRSVR